MQKAIRNILLLTVAIILSATLNSFVIPADSMAIFILPGLSWGLALTLSVYNRIEDPRFSIGLFSMGSVVLWLVMLFLGGVLGPLLAGLSLLFAFPLLGAIGGLGSYMLYSRLVLFQSSPKHAVVCFCLGYLSFFNHMLTGYEEKILLQGNLFIIFYWQVLVGAGHVVAYAGRRKTASQPPLDSRR